MTLLLTGWDITGIVASIMAAALAAPVLGLAIRQELRATRRAVVEWQDEKVSDGRFLIRNIGLDKARNVTVRAWTVHESVEETARSLPPGEMISVHLRKREITGPDLPDLPPRMSIPRVPDEMPTMDDNPLFSGSRMEAERQAAWKQQKTMQDMRDAQEQMLIQSATSSQVAISIVWKSKHGQWHKEDLRTG